MALDFVLIDFVVRELSFFAAFWLCLGAIDDLGIDLLWLRLQATDKTQATGKTRETPHIDPKPAAQDMPLALFIPVWQEAAVIAHTLRTIATNWANPALRI